MTYELDVLRYLSEHNITLADAARAAGVASQNIRKSLENNPKSSTVLAVANGLGLDPRDFFYTKEEVSAMPMEQEDIEENTSQEVQTEAFCPHCGGKVRVGVVLLPE